ncbi:TRZ/ATZ family hydrolase [Ectothiorhodospiraceae bacterium WFHF3C12]|nr:TRZ/ATZ family hydrolase [Ectothiorhodospiraceae bacterium WFHF3C12]
MEQVDTLINARWVVPVEPAGEALPWHSVAVRDGRIVAVLPDGEARRRYEAEQTTDLPDHALIPGLINSHTHASMTLMRGLADDLPLMRWLTEHIWPAEQAHVGPDFVHAGTELGVAEMLRGGITCFGDMYFFPEITARVARAAGMRAVVGMIVIDFPSAYAGGPDEYLDKGLALHDSLRHDPLISTAFAPHAPYTVGGEYLARIRKLADELEVPVHTHVHETAHEVEESVEQTGKRPLERLREMGLVSPNLLAAHMTQLTDQEIADYAADGGNVVHCPESNLKLASGFCRVQALLDQGVNVSLGTDGAASNNDLDMFGEMRTAALLAKGVAGDAAALPAAQALKMATINGARALGIADQTGSLVAGKDADITAVDLGDIGSQPVYNPVSQIVYSTGRHQVSDVWVAGRHLVTQGRLTTVNSDEVLKAAANWRDKLEINSE